MHKTLTSNRVKKNIAVLFPLSKKQGAFQYALSIADSLINYSDKFNYLILYYGSENPKDSLKIKDKDNVQFISLNNRPNRLIGKIRLLFNAFTGKPLFSVNKENERILKDIKANLLIIPFPLLLGLESKIPYIVSILDIMHRYYPGFPEYPFWERLKRDIVYKFSAKHSLLSIVDSGQGIEDLCKFYKIPKKKIRAISFFPSGYVHKYKDMDQGLVSEIIEKYNLPEKFLFYPAQFWYHKNHLRLLKALKLIEEKNGVKIPLVLVGDSNANKNNYQKIMDLAKGLDVRHLGYVSDKEVVALYKKSTALVFTSLGGPTNIPPLEAMILGTPVLCSNLFEMPKQVGGAGLLFDPFNVGDMADKIYRIWTDERLRKELIEKGLNRAKSFTLENYAKIWETTIEQAINLKNYGK